MSKIVVFFEDVKNIKLKKSALSRYVKTLINNENKKLGSVSVVFCSDDYLLDMNKKYLDHHYFTDIITFDYVEGDIISGDLFISVERLKENAEKFGNSFTQELYRVVFHGVLHLVGYNDKTKEEKIKMRAMENFYLNGVDFSEVEL